MPIPMIDVKTARDIDDLKRQTYINFRNIRQRIDTYDTKVVDPNTGTVLTPTSPGGNTFDIIYIGPNGDAWITYNNNGDLVFHDKYAGDVTLSEMLECINRFWEYKDAYGPKAQTIAGNETWIGSMEDSDGVTNFNSTDEVE